jgi:hypothetical protein
MVMARDPLLTEWQERHTLLWGNQPICVGHRLHESPLFSRRALEALVEHYPREHYSIIHMGPQGTKSQLWREGDLGGLSGGEVLAAIASGRLWLNLRHVDRVDGRYGEIVQSLFAELAERVPGLKTWGHGCGILISSPNAQVYYHADLPGHGLVQIAGRKRVYFYPPQEPFVTPEHLEEIAISELEVGIPYRNWYDEYAQVFEFEPGQMLWWPHTAPHRIENHDCLNVSMTVDFATETVRRTQMVIMGNALLRQRLGWTPRSRAISGAAFWAKALLQKALRNSSWQKSKAATHRRIQFRLQRAAGSGAVDLVEC